MYDELVKQCRDCIDCLCGDCKYEHLQKPGNFVPCMNALLGEAADAIEELSKDRDNWKATAKEEREEYWHWFDQYQKDVPRWIPVTERLPEEAGYYITAFSKGEVGQNLYMTFADRSGKWYQNSEDTGEVTHWVPLPEPPEKG